MTTFFRLVFASVFFFGTSTILAETPSSKQFQYRVRIPATALTCEQEAVLLAEKFAQTTALQPDRSQCREVLTVTFDQKTYQLYSLVLTYTAAQPLTPYSARFGTANYTGTQGRVGGLYSTFEKCLQDSAFKKIIFENHTALPVVSTVCEVAPFGRQFLLQIDSFGTPAKTLYTYFPNYKGSPEIHNFIPTLIAQLGGTLVDQVDGSYLYFSTAPVYIHSDDFGGFASEEECKAQLMDTREIFMKSGSQFVYAACVSMDRLQAIGDGTGAFMRDYGTYSEAYYSFAECMNDKSRVLDECRAIGKATFGAICRPDFSNRQIYRVELYDVIPQDEAARD